MDNSWIDAINNIAADYTQYRVQLLGAPSKPVTKNPQTGVVVQDGQPADAAHSGFMGVPVAYLVAGVLGLGLVGYLVLRKK